jgi:hypothetical protein
MATEQVHPSLEPILEKVKKHKDLSDKARQPYIPRWREWYGLHRNYRRYNRAYSAADSENDRDEVRREAQRDFGAELFIPYVFTIIETVLPAILMNNPRMRIKPKPGLTAEAADAIKGLYEERQAEINYALKLQPMARQGLKYGLGVGKTFWQVKGRTRPVIERGIFGIPVKKEKFVVSSKGPAFEPVEVEDFFWDPAAADIEHSRFAIHRTWRDFRYVRERVERGEWLPIDLEAVKNSGGNAAARSEMISQRAESSGLSNADVDLGDLHEVWEYHDGNEVHTVLDESLVVQSAPNPFTHRELPFQIYRPTIQEGEFVGIGEIEPIVHLQYELNTLRSQRRDNATLVLQKAFMYAEGLVDPADLIVGPGKGIPVYGNPNEVLVPLNIGEIPNSGYQEEAAIKSDIELASGISETAAGGGGVNNASAETATGIELVQAAANRRVELKIRNLHAEAIKPAADQWLELWRQNVIDEPVEVTTENEQGGFSHMAVEAKDFDGVRSILPEEESTGPENTPQKRNDALALFNQTANNEVIDPRKRAIALLRAFDVPDAESWIIPEQTQMNPQVAMMLGHSMKDALVQAGLEEDQAEQMTEFVMQNALSATGVSEPPMAQNTSNGAQPQEAM